MISTPEQEKVESNSNNDNISFESLLIAENGDNESLSSGLSISERQQTHDADLNLYHDDQTLSQRNNISDAVAKVVSSDGVSSLMTLFNSPDKSDDGDVHIMSHNKVVVGGLGENDNYEVEVAFEPMTARRMTERVSNSNHNSAVPSRDGSVCGMNYKDMNYHTSVETDYLLTGTKNRINDKKRNNYGNLERKFIEDNGIPGQIKDKDQSQCKACFQFSWESIKATISGSVMFILFHILFCLAQASAIHRPHSSKSILGAMTRMSALGPIVGKFLC